MIFVILEIRLQEEFIYPRIAWFGRVFMEKSWSKFKIEKSITKREIHKIHKNLLGKFLLVKFIKMWLIHCSKLKYNITRRKIMKKTCNVAQNRAQNDPIHCRIKAFHSAFWKTKIQSSSSKFFMFSQWNLDFKYSLDAEMTLEEEENEILKCPTGSINWNTQE